MNNPGRFIKSFIPVAALLTLFAFMAVSSMLRKSATFDEPLHLAAGYSYWTQNEYRFSTENGNLAQRWAALPLLFGTYHFPQKVSGNFRTGFDFLFNSGNDAKKILMQGRAMMVLLGIALGALVYLWSSELFGRAGGLISLTLYCFSPAILAHSRLTTSDLTVALFFTLAMWCVWKMLHRVTLATFIGSAFAIGGLLVSKMSGLLILPMAITLMIIRLISDRPIIFAVGEAKSIHSRNKRVMVFLVLLLVQVVLVSLIVRGFYGFRFSAKKPAPTAIEAPTAEKPEAKPEETPPKVVARPSQMPALFHYLLDFARTHHLLPEAYLRGLDVVARYSLVRPAFFKGQYGAGGWPWFFPYCFLVKTPLPLFFLLLLSAVGTVLSWLKRHREEQQSLRDLVGHSLYRTSPLWVLLITYWTMAICTPLNIGERHILPVYPATFILAGAAAFWFQRRYLVPAFMVAAATFLFMLESVRIWPDYLAYFNQLVGGPQNGYKHLVDSNLDWGQDLPALKDWLEQNELAHQESTPVYLSYFGNGNPKYYGIDVQRLPGHLDLDSGKDSHSKLQGGIYCISATMLQTVHLLPEGAWTESNEASYRSLLIAERVTKMVEKSKSDHAIPVEQKGEHAQVRQQNLRALEKLRFARLCAYLRNRTPNEFIGYSILVYRLTHGDIEEAQYGSSVLFPNNKATMNINKK